MGRLAAKSTRITNHDMWIAAKALAEQVTETQLNVGCLYPPLSQIREVSAHIAVAIAEHAYATGTATAPTAKDQDMIARVQSLMYDPFEDPF